MSNETQKAVLWSLWTLAGVAMGFSAHEAHIYAQDQWDEYCQRKWSVRRYEGPGGPRAYIIDQEAKP